MKEFTTITWKEGKWYVAKALEIEVASQGKTRAEAISNLLEAISLYFEDNNTINVLEVENPELKKLSINLHA